MSDYMREVALRLAVEHAKNMEIEETERVLEIGDQFYEFITTDPYEVD